MDTLQMFLLAAALVVLPFFEEESVLLFAFEILLQLQGAVLRHKRPPGIFGPAASFGKLLHRIVGHFVFRVVNEAAMMSGAFLMRITIILPSIGRAERH